MVLANDNGRTLIARQMRGERVMRARGEPPFYMAM